MTKHDMNTSPRNGSPKPSIKMAMSVELAKRRAEKSGASTCLSQNFCDPEARQKTGAFVRRRYVGEQILDQDCSYAYIKARCSYHGVSEIKKQMGERSFQVVKKVPTGIITQGLRIWRSEFAPTE